MDWKNVVVPATTKPAAATAAAAPAAAPAAVAPAAVAPAAAPAAAAADKPPPSGQYVKGILFRIKNSINYTRYFLVSLPVFFYSQSVRFSSKAVTGRVWPKLRFH